MKEIEKYVKKNFPKVLREVSTSFRASEASELTNPEKAIIYKYSDDEYQFVNEHLKIHKGKLNEFGRLLDGSLSKLPDYKKLCYRAVKLSANEIKKYMKAYNSSSTITEYSFVSCSRSKLLAMQFSHNVLFRIQSKKGKDIQKIAKFGINSGQNEKEILFRANSKFNVLDMTKENNKTLITMEEV